jgi:hypothetical protein
LATAGGRLEGPTGRGIEFGLEGSNGVERDVWSVLAAGTWRFAQNHRVGFQSFNTKRSSSRTTEQELVLEDQTIRSAPSSIPAPRHNSWS